MDSAPLRHHKLPRLRRVVVTLICWSTHVPVPSSPKVHKIQVKAPFRTRKFSFLNEFHVSSASPRHYLCSGTFLFLFPINPSCFRGRGFQKYVAISSSQTLPVNTPLHFSHPQCPLSSFYRDATAVHVCPCTRLQCRMVCVPTNRVISG